MWTEISSHAEVISAFSATLAVGATAVGCVPCGLALGSIAVITGEIAAGQEAAEGDYLWAAIDSVTASLGAATPLAKLLGEAATLAWDTNRLAWAVRAAHSREALDRVKANLDLLSAVLADISLRIKQMQEEPGPCTSSA